MKRCATDAAPRTGMAEYEGGMKKIIAAGHICVDITPVFRGDAPAAVEEILKPGRLIQVGEAAINLGGSVSNTGLALARLGADVRLMGKAGDDAFGHLLLSLLEERGAGGLIVDPAGETSYTVVLAIPGHDRLFLHNPGANDTFSADDIPQEALEEAALFHFGYPTLMRRMYEDGGRELIRMYRRAREAGCATSLDLAAVDPRGPAGGADWAGILAGVLPYTDFFVPSFEELCFMLDRDKWTDMNARNGDPMEHPDLRRDAMPLAEKALSLGCAAVLLKCGTSGMVLLTADGERTARTGRRLRLDADAWKGLRICQPCYRAPVVKSTTGAGDSSIAAFLAAAADGRDPADCVRLAAAEGAMAVTEYEALAAVLPLEELEKRIEAGWPTE